MIRKKQNNEGPLIVDLTGPDGNAFVLLGAAKKWAEQLDLDWKIIRKEATSDDYEHLVKTLDKYFGEYIIFER